MDRYTKSYAEPDVGITDENGRYGEWISGAGCEDFLDALDSINFHSGNIVNDPEGFIGDKDDIDLIVNDFYDMYKKLERAAEKAKASYDEIYETHRLEFDPGDDEHF